MPSISIVECFARIQRGYCEYYASTMAVLLREMGIPTRFVQGFLPGDGEPGAGTSVGRNRDSHAWVQVYFPGYGWIDFDPTGGGRPTRAAAVRRARSRARRRGASRSPARFTRRRRRLPARRARAAASGRRAQDDRGSAGPLIAVAILLAVIVAAIAAVAWRRGPRGPVSADGTYGSVTRLASRLGFAPRPNQTVYEYAGALGDVLPTVSPELETVAHAKVEVAYGGRVLSDDRMRSLREAHRRLRVGLLRLFVRRLRRPRVAASIAGGAAPGGRSLARRPDLERPAPAAPFLGLLGRLVEQGREVARSGCGRAGPPAGTELDDA